MGTARQLAVSVHNCGICGGEVCLALSGRLPTAHLLQLLNGARRSETLALCTKC
jgi:hypothetical protein